MRAISGIPLTRNQQINTSMHVRDVIVHGELVPETVFVGEDVDHPTEDHRHEGAFAAETPSNYRAKMRRVEVLEMTLGYGWGLSP
jgi:hypothetical protein